MGVVGLHAEFRGISENGICHFHREHHLCHCWLCGTAATEDLMPYEVHATAVIRLARVGWKFCFQVHKRAVDQLCCACSK